MIPTRRILSKIVRGFDRDRDDARNFLRSGLVDARRLRDLVRAIPDAACARYPRLSRAGVEAAVEEFLAAEE